MRSNRLFPRALIGATVLSLLTAGATAVASPAAAEPTGQASTVAIFGEPGDGVTNGTPLLWRTPDPISVEPYGNGIKVVATDPGAPLNQAIFVITPPAGAPTLAPGTYEDTRPISTSTNPGLGIIGSDNGCGGLYRGRFEVLDLAPDLSTAWILFESRCNGSDATAFGEIRVNQPVEGGLLVTPSRVSWPNRPAGIDQSRVRVTLVNTGAEAITVAGVAVEGAGAAAFAVTSNSCGTLVPGTSCAVELGYRPILPGPLEAALTVNSSAAGTHQVQLRAPGLDPSDPFASALGVAPGPITQIRFQSSYGDLDLSWVNPADLDWVETVICRAPGTTPPASPDSCTVAYRGRDSTAVLTDLVEPGATESLAFFAVDAEGLVSAAANLTIPGVTLTAAARPARLVYGKKFTITGELRDAVSGAPLEFRDLQVIAVDPYTGEPYEPDAVRTAAGGKYTYRYGPGENYVWYVLFAGDDTHNGTITRELPVPVSKAIYVDPLKKKDTLAHGVTLFVGVDPLSPGTKVTVEQLVKGKWKKVATKKLSKKGYAQIKIKPKTKGTYTYRVYAPADRRSEGNTSKKVTVILT